MPVLREIPSFELEVPIVIVGAGACGCAAALAAADAGAEAIILERDAKPAGNTSLSGGQIIGAGTKLQKAAGVDDTPAFLAQDLISKARGQCDPAMAQRIAEVSAPTVDWLVERHGVVMTPMTEFHYPNHSRPHIHMPAGFDGASLHAALLRAVADAGVDIATSAPVTSLFADHDDRIRGVQITRPDGTLENIGCDALILACNGFGGNPDLVRKYIPQIVDAPHCGHAGNQGDAVLWGEGLGASLKDLSSFQGHGAVCTPHMTRLNWGVVAQGGIQVNALGKRFSHENAGYSEQGLIVRSQPGNVAWAVWDERCEKAAGTMVCHQQSWSEGAIKRISDVAGLAAYIGCDVAALEATFAEIADLAANKKLCPYGRDFSITPLMEAPFICSKITGALFHTQGGLEVDGDARVLRADGSRFPNLFAGGGAARGLSGPADWGYLSGSGLLVALNLGRLAGETAAAQVKS